MRNEPVGVNVLHLFLLPGVTLRIGHACTVGSGLRNWEGGQTWVPCFVYRPQPALRNNATF